MLVSAITIFLSAFLLFQVQPMIAKMILPWFGGSSSVWITAMLFFQLVLLAGYLYAHWLVRSLRPQLQAAVHIGLLGLCLLFLPVAAAPAWKPAGAGEPITSILGLLFVSIGLPYFALSATSPLVQAWHARRCRTALPYRLFSLSNLASLIGLLAYPVVVERAVTLRGQSLGWSALFAVFAGCCAVAAWAARSAAVPASLADAGPEVPSPRPKPSEQLFWVVLAAASSTMLLAVTNHLTQNVASIPFLWVLPLGIYLLTFILTFDHEKLYSRTLFSWLMAPALGAMAYGLVQWNSHTRLSLVIPVYAAGLFVVAQFCHGELVKRKPAPEHLTSFYLMLSIGGALGGLLVGLLAPKLLPAYFELPFALVLAAVLVLVVIEYRKRMLLLALSWATAAAIVLAAGYYVTSYGRSARVMVRNFYGGLRVQEFNVGTVDESRFLVHGTVTHGMQYWNELRRREPISYYGPESGVALAEQHLRRKPSLRVGVIGLGAGSLAAYARSRDHYRFYEINPLIEKLARQEFTFLADCRGTAEVVLGDGRLSLEREPDRRFDLLVVDAFSGDAIPVHLLTREALELYFHRLAADGILALHITNTHLELEPIVAKLAEALGKEVVVIARESDTGRLIYRSTWALLSDRPIGSNAIAAAGRKPAARPDLRLWTDEYSNLFAIVK